MDRLYRALMWLAGLALVVGLAKALLLWTREAISLSSGSGMSSSDGFFSMILTITRMMFVGSGGMLESLAATNLLIGGVTVMALVITWADHRRGWLIALIIVTVLALIWPTGVQIWDVSGLPLAPQPYPMPVSAFAQVMNDAVYAMPLIPLMMALVLGLTRRDGAAHGAHGVAVQPV